MNYKPLTTYHILNCTRCINVNVYASNELPRVFGDGILISNLSKTTELGTHWILFYKKNDVIYYFDSLALNILRKDIKIFLKNNCKYYYCSNKRVQSYKTVTCGHWVVVLAHYLHSGGTIQKFLDNFNKNFFGNDSKILLEFYKMFGIVADRGSGLACAAYLSKKHHFKTQFE
jgi:hypothetical protein